MAKHASSKRVVVLGIMGRTSLAGVIWQVLHYLEGFRRLGLDVYYIEDTEAWPYDPQRHTVTDDCAYAVNAIGEAMARFGFSGRWAYRSLDGRFLGLSDSEVDRLFEQADVLVNLTASTPLREQHLRVPLRIYLETDPVLPQIEVFKGNPRYIEWLAAHTHHFTFGENLGAPDCGVPVRRFRYFPTRQPVVLDWWADLTRKSSNGAPANEYWDGQELLSFSKRRAYLTYLDIPQKAGLRARRQYLSARKDRRSRALARRRMAPGQPQLGRPIADQVSSLHQAIARGILLPETLLQTIQQRLVQRPQRGLPGQRPPGVGRRDGIQLPYPHGSRAVALHDAVGGTRRRQRNRRKLRRPQS